MKNNKILVTGYNGLVGSNFIKTISKSDKNNYVLLGRKPIEGFDYIYSDLGKRIDFDKLPKNISTVIYIAQSNNYKDFNKSNDILNVNYNRVLDILKWGQVNSLKKIIYFSSGSVYKFTDDKCFEEDMLNTTSNNPYINSKIKAEEVLFKFSNIFKITIFRPFFIYGPNQKESMLISGVFKKFIDNKEIELKGHNQILFNPIFVDDVSKIIHKFIINDIEGTFNLCGNDILSINELVNNFEKIFKKKAKTKVIDLNEKTYMVGSNSKLNQYFNVNEMTNIYNGLLRTFGETK